MNINFPSKYPQNLAAYNNSTPNPNVFGSITAPASCQDHQARATDQFSITGSVGGPDFQNYSLCIAYEGEPNTFYCDQFLINDETAPVNNGELALYNSYDPRNYNGVGQGGAWTLKLSVNGANGTNEYFYPLCFDLDLQYGWPKIVGLPNSAAEKSVVTLADTAGDGIDRIFLNSKSACTANLWDLIGPSPYLGSLIWSRPNGCTDAAPAAADLNGDGRNDFVWATGGTVYAVRGSDGADLPGFPVSLAGANGNVSLGDLNGDGNLEIVVPADKTLYALNRDGSIYKSAIIPVVPNDIPSISIVSPVSLCKLNADRNVQAVFTAGRDVFVYDGALNKVWSQYMGAVSNVPVTCADLDKNGYQEVYVSGNPFLAFDRAGNALWGGPRNLSTMASSGIAGDINGDGKLELMVSVPGDSVNVWDSLGERVNPYPVLPFVTKYNNFAWGVIASLEPGSNAKFVVPSYLSLGEGVQDRVDGGMVALYDQTGLVSNGHWPKATMGSPGLSSAAGFPNYLAPNLGYVVTAVSNSQGTLIYPYSVGDVFTNRPENLPWPAFNYNNQRTGSVPPTVQPPPGPEYGPERAPEPPLPEPQPEPQVEPAPEPPLLVEPQPEPAPEPPLPEPQPEPQPEPAPEPPFLAEPQPEPAPEPPCDGGVIIIPIPDPDRDAGTDLPTDVYDAGTEATPVVLDGGNEPGRDTAIVIAEDARVINDIRVMPDLNISRDTIVVSDTGWRFDLNPGEEVNGDTSVPLSPEAGTFSDAKIAVDPDAPVSRPDGRVANPDAFVSLDAGNDLPRRATDAGKTTVKNSSGGCGCNIGAARSRERGTDDLAFLARSLYWWLTDKKSAN